MVGRRPTGVNERDLHPNRGVDTADIIRHSGIGAVPRHLLSSTTTPTRQESACMDVTLAVLADYASVTREGKVNILGVFTEINPLSFPVTLPQMFLVIVWQASPAESGTSRRTRVSLADADGKEILRMEQTLQVPTQSGPGTRPQINQLLGLSGVRFDHAGSYQFSILAEEDEKRSISFVVNEPPERSSDVDEVEQ